MLLREKHLPHENKIAKALSKTQILLPNSQISYLIMIYNENFFFFY